MSELLQKESGQTMTLEWTAEQNTLHSIKKIIDKAWRMNSRQLHSCCKRLRHSQRELLPGRIGNVFLAHLEQIADRQDDMDKEAVKEKDWPQLQRDTGQLIQLISRYGQLEKEAWLAVLPKLEAHQEKYFQTELGPAFILTLKEKLGLAEPENSRVHAAETARENRPAAVHAENKAELENLAAWLMQDSPPRHPLQMRKNPKFLYSGNDRKDFRRTLFAERMHNSAVFIFASLSVCFMTAWLYGQIVRNQSAWSAQQLKVSASQKADAADAGNAQGALNENSQLNAAAVTEKPAAVSQLDSAQDTLEYGAQQGDLSSKKIPAEDRQGTQYSTGKQSEQNAARAKRPKIQKQYQKMAAEYPGLFGWLQIPGTQIDQPVMQPFKEKEFYLDHDFTGADSAEGALFTDPGNSCWPQDGNTVIYGHNMKNGHMFGTLDSYEDADFFRAHTEIRFDTIYETGRYEAAAVLKTRILNENEQGFRYYQFFNFKNRAEFQKCLDFVKENQLFETQSSLQYGDRILMLSTCEYSQENGRLVIVARKIS